MGTDATSKKSAKSRGSRFWVRPGRTAKGLLHFNIGSAAGRFVLLKCTSTSIPYTAQCTAYDTTMLGRVLIIKISN